MMNDERVRNHLPPTVLEALAAGDSADVNDRAHLLQCQVCSERLNAMIQENHAFLAELSANPQENSMLIAPSERVPLVGSTHKPFVLFASVAAIMLIVATGIVAFHAGRDSASIERALPVGSAKSGGEAPQPPAAEAEMEKEQPKPGPAPEAGDPKEPVYEGKTATEWLALLNTSDASKARLRKEAQHALQEIGEEGLPQILKSLREMGTDDTYALLRTPGGIVVEQKHYPQFIALLKDPDFKIRKAAAILLENVAGDLRSSDPPNSRAINEIAVALSIAAKDRDKAVVEAARYASVMVENVYSGYVAVYVAQKDFKGAEAIVAGAKTSGIIRGNVMKNIEEYFQSCQANYLKTKDRPGQ